jgi:RimJ/RimL family protein N-acetyltransferase
VKIYFGADAFVAQWVSERIPHMRGAPFGPNAALAVLSDSGAMLGGVVYHNYLEQYRSLEMSAAAASKRWLAPEVLRAIFRYPFAQLNCRRVTMITSTRNTEARKLLKGLGFHQEGQIRCAFSNSEDAAIYGLLAREWRRGKLFQKRGTARAA